MRPNKSRQRRVSVAIGILLVAGARASAAEETLPECQARLEQARRTYDQLLPGYLEHAYTPSLFASGAPNAAAYQALLPALERAFKDVAKNTARPPAALALECRTFACRLKVLQPAGSDTAAWENALTTHPALAARVRSSEVSARRPNADPLTGEALVEATVLLRLADTSGGPAGTTPLAPQRPQPLPASLQLCGKEIDSLQRKIDRINKTVARDLSPADRFGSQPVNDSLTREMTALLGPAMTTPSALEPPRIACRALICEVTLPHGRTLDRESWLKLWKQPGWRERVMGVAPSGDRAYLRIRPASAADGRDVLARLLATIHRQTFFAECHARHPATGHLLVRYVLPACGAGTPRTAALQIKLEFSGSLADTPLARCVNEHLEQAVSSAPLPDQVLGAYRDVRYDWRRSSRPGMQFDPPRPGPRR